MRWTTEECKLLRELYPNTKDKDLVPIFKRSTMCILKKARRIGLAGKDTKHKAKVTAEWIANNAEKCIRPRKYLVNERYFQSVDTPEKAYWYGFLWADGNVQTGSTKRSYQRVRLYLHEKDKYAVEEFVKAIQGTMLVEPQNGYGIKNHNFGCAINSHKMVADLVKLNIIPDKCHKQEIPIISDELFPHFFLGLFDGDGTVFVKGNQHTIGISCTRATGDWLIDMIDKHVGVNSNHYKGGGEYARNWSVNGFFQTKDLAEWMYADAGFFLKRKYEYFAENGLLSSKVTL
jgi:hypothetical protein